MSVAQAEPPHRVLELFSGIGGWRLALQQVLGTRAPAALHVTVFNYCYNVLNMTSHSVHDLHNMLTSLVARLLLERRSIARAAFGWRPWIRIGKAARPQKFSTAKLKLVNWGVHLLQNAAVVALNSLLLTT